MTSNVRNSALTKVRGGRLTKAGAVQRLIILHLYLTSFNNSRHGLHAIPQCACTSDAPSHHFTKISTREIIASRRRRQVFDRIHGASPALGAGAHFVCIEGIFTAFRGGTCDPLGNAGMGDGHHGMHINIVYSVGYDSKTAGTKRALC